MLKENDINLILHPLEKCMLKKHYYPHITPLEMYVERKQY